MLIDELQAGVFEEVDRFLDNERGRLNAYILIDGAFVPGLYKEFGVEKGEANVQVLFKELPGADDDVLNVSPFVFHLESMTPKMRTLLRRCGGWPMLSLIESDESLHLLAERLASWCIVANDGVRFNFRFADTRRLPAIVQTLGTGQLGSMFGSARRIRYINRFGDWEYLDLPGSARKITTRPQTIMSPQFSKLVEDGEVDVIVGQLKGLGYMSDWKSSTQFVHVASAVSAAVAGKLTAEETLEWCKASVQLKISTPTTIVAELEQWRSNIAT